ncbi:nectin-4 isoform X2 [Hypomesus transpacificus]|uniref:nectin-4 isoform X2 n=1 Tax=Hypomesus transpacificus TaxID=137520 RepID=UPI001F07C23E|nr:nectin-4 isoform X2 [Hypomesus transpacificus]
MKSHAWAARQRTEWMALIWAFVVSVQGGFVEPPPSFSLRSLAESETRLPCHYQVGDGEQVIQVTWTRELSDGTKEKILTAHHNEVHTEVGPFSGRVKFDSVSPANDSALLLLSTQESDEGSYTCHISTFPSGNFERKVSLTVETTHTAPQLAEHTPPPLPPPVVSVQGGFVEPPPSFSLRSLAESETRLPCHYQVGDGEQVIQVTWTRELSDGTKEQVITAHPTEGHTEFGRFSGRVKFESVSPTDNSALLLLSTQESDEGSYTCHISTFPSGNFERKVSLTVWTLPISSLEPVVLTEGQSFRVAATCRAVAHPPPRLSWDTALPGQAQNRSSGGGAISAFFSLHPLRSMNGKRLDCLVWHPGLRQPRRISNTLQVHFPPDVSITGHDGNWFIGREGAELRCESGGYPKPQNFTWTRRGGSLTGGVSVLGNRLLFGQALSLNDTGVYECVAQNSAGAGKAEFTLTVTERRVQEPTVDSLLLIVVGASAGALVLIMIIIIFLVHRYHRRRTKNLEMELGERTEEMNTLSRQASFRRINSVGSDPRALDEDSVSLRVDNRMKHSQLSLEDRPLYRGSQSTLGGRRAALGELEVDHLGRPLLYQSSWRECRGRARASADMDGGWDEQRRRRVESYLRNSHMSLDSGLPSSHPQQDSGESHTTQDPSPPAPDWCGTQGPEDWASSLPLPEGDEVDCDTSYQISEAFSNHFDYSNGFLRPKPHSNAILLHPRGQVI